MLDIRRSKDREGTKMPECLQLLQAVQVVFFLHKSFCPQDQSHLTIFFSPGGSHFLGLHPNNLPGGSDGKESVCNAGDPASIPGLGRSPGEGNGFPFCMCLCTVTKKTSGFQASNLWKDNEVKKL